MKPLVLAAGDDVPEVNFNRNRSEFLIAGRSIPEDAFAFYSQIFEWLELYKINPNPSTTLRVRLEYYNTSSAKQLSKLFVLMQSIEGDVKIIWNYDADDDETRLYGETYKRMFKMDFKMEPIDCDEDNFQIIKD